MKKEKIYNIVIASICFALWFLPAYYTYDSHYGFTMQSFCIMLFSGSIFEIWALKELLIIVIGCATIILIIVHIIKDTKATKLLASIGISAYVVLWIFAIFVSFPNRLSILLELSNGAYIFWLIPYFAMLITIIVLIILQYRLPPRRPSKSTRLEQRIAELEKQVDELKKGE